MTNKINVNIETMNSSYLGIKGLNVSDDTGVSATYAVDAIADALQKVSDQRSSLGAVQNRLDIQSLTLTMLLRIQHLLSHVSVMSIWLRRWLSTARTTFLLRLDSLCLHRLTRLHREFSPYSANHKLMLIIPIMAA